jgi:hypothetical protein
MFDLNSPILGNVVDSSSGCVGLIDILENQIAPGKLVGKEYTSTRVLGMGTNYLTRTKPAGW